MMPFMASVVAETSDLYNAIPKDLASVLEGDPKLAPHQAENPSPEPMQATNSTGESQHRTLKRFTDVGLEAYNHGKLEEAAKNFEEALALCAGRMLPLYCLGVIYGQLKRYEDSRDAFERFLHLLEKQGSGDATLLAKAHQGIGASLLNLWVATGRQEPSLGVIGDAELEFRRALELDPNYFEAWLGLGLALHIMDRFDDAESAFRKALELDPNSKIATERLRTVLEDKLEKRLFELGYLSKVNKPIRDFSPYENRTLIRVEGKPLSEVIVEERR